jgi:CDP-glycerol glycerophosphotransferase (TagB/SpsB family)
MKLFRTAGTLARGLLSNAVYFLSGFAPRDKNLWLFGAWEGKMYRDNARDLFEHAVKNARPGRRVFWITGSPDVARKLREKGLPVLESSSPRAWSACLRAGVVFVTHGRHDVVKSLTRGAAVIYLNHALPIKHMGYDIKSNPYLHAKPLRRLVYKLIDPYWTLDFDYALSASPQTAGIVSSSMHAPADRVWPLGFPRFASLARAARSSQAAGRKRRVLYMPTFRDRAGFSHFGYGFDLAEVERRLAALDAELLIALHPFDRSPVPDELKARSDGRARLFSPPDVNELLPGIDALVTDFSSVAFDYLILDRPMIFTQFDYADFVSTERGTYFAYDDVTPGPKARDWPALLDALDDALLRGRDEFAPRRAEVRARFLKQDYSDVNERIIAHVERLGN